MPEGPEIRRATDSIHRAIAGNIASDVFFAFDHLKPYEDDLVGCTVTAVIPYGKAIVTYFDNGLGVYSHNQLYGKWVTCKPNVAALQTRHGRLSGPSWVTCESNMVALQDPTWAPCGPLTDDLRIQYGCLAGPDMGALQAPHG